MIHVKVTCVARQAEGVRKTLIHMRCHRPDAGGDFACNRCKDEVKLPTLEGASRNFSNPGFELRRYARALVQLPADRPVSADPALWQCQETGATDNLWLNLSTGVIGSGRQVS